MLNDTFWSDGRQTKSNTGQVYSRLIVGKIFNPKQEMQIECALALHVFFQYFFSKKKNVNVIIDDVEGSTITYTRNN